jgi:hypothetical protein
MASPCVYTINGEQKSFEDYIDMLHNMDDAELDGLIEKGDKQVEKTITKKRAFDATQDEDVKRAIKRNGLYRDKSDTKDTISRAESFVSEVGFGQALKAVVDDPKIPQPMKAAIAGELITLADKEIKNPKALSDSEFRQALENYANAIEALEVHGNSAGTTMGILPHVYKKLASEGVDFYTDKLADQYIDEWKNSHDGLIPDSLKKEFEKSSEKLKEVSDKLIELEQKIADQNAHIAMMEAREKAETKAKEKSDLKAKEAKKKALDKQLNDGLSEMFGAIASATGGKMSAVDSDEKFFRGAKKAVSALMQKAEISAQEAFEQLIELAKSKGLNTDKLQTSKDEILSMFEEKVKGIFGLSNEKLQELAMQVDMGKETPAEKQVEQFAKLIKEEIKDTHPDIQEREIRDELSRYGKTTTESPLEAKQKLSKLKTMFRLTSQLEDIAKGERPLKTGFQRQPTDTEVRRLMKMVREGLKTLPIDQSIKDNLLRTAQEAHIQRLKNRIADKQKEIDTGVKTKSEKQKVDDNDQIIMLKQELEQVQAKHDEKFKNENEAEKQQKSLEASKRALKRRIEELETKLKNNDFSKRVKQKQLMDNERAALLAKKEDVLENFDNARKKYEYEHRDNPQKYKDLAKESWRLGQVIATGADFGIAGVQLFGAISRSVWSDLYNIRKKGYNANTAKAFADSFKAFASPEYAQNKIEEIKGDKYYASAKKAKLDVLGANGAETEFKSDLLNDSIKKAFEKTLGSAIGKEKAEKLAEAINPKAFERWSNTLSNSLRFKAYKDAAIAAEAMGYDIENDLKAFKDIAGTINTFTGRASTGLTGWVKEGAGLTLFSPRNWASMIKTATPVGLYRYYKMGGNDLLETGHVMNSPARREATRQFLALTTAATSIVMLKALIYNNDDDEDTNVNITDPDRADFFQPTVKLKNGNVIQDDYTGGRIRMIITMVKFYKALFDKEVTSLKGSEYMATPFDVVQKHALGKTSPTASILKDRLMFKRKEVNGEMRSIDPFTKEPVDWAERAIEAYKPMAGGDILDIMQSDPSLFEGLHTISTAFGLSNVNKRYDEKK